MNNLFTDIEIIDRYLKGVSKEYEREIVRERLASDSKFRQLFDDIELMIEGIKETAVHTSKEEKLEHLRNFFNEAYEPVEELDKPVSTGKETIGSSSEDYEAPTPGSGLGKGKVISFPAADLLSKYKVAVAAAVTLLIAAWFIVFQMSPVTNQQLFADYFVPFKNMGGNTRGESTDISERKQAYTAYDNEEWEQAVRLFNIVIPESDNQILDKFHLGVAYLALQEPENAIAQLEDVENLAAGLAADSKWYLGLSYLLLDDVEKAVVKFEEVKELNGQHSKEAAKILNKLQ